MTDMSGMFNSASGFNHDVSRWDVSRVKNMSMMFANASAFIHDVNRWDVS